MAPGPVGVALAVMKAVAGSKYRRPAARAPGVAGSVAETMGRCCLFEAWRKAAAAGSASAWRRDESHLLLLVVLDGSVLAPVSDV